MLKARLSLLSVVQRDIHARKELKGDLVPPSSTMCKVWDSGLYQQPADFSILRGLWQAQNQMWMADWLACCDGSPSAQQTSGISCAEASSLQRLTARGLT